MFTALLNDTKLQGIIWHECGHKFLNQPKEAGEVFAYELRMIRQKLGKEQARKWIMGEGRTPEYFRSGGLQIDPGKEDLLLELKEILPDEIFSKEFGQAYETIMGTAPKKEEVKKELAAESVSVGKTIEGTISQLKKMVPSEDITGTRGSIVPANAGIDATVKFAGKQWKVLGKEEATYPIKWKLQCTSLSEVSLNEGDGPVPVGTVYAFGTKKGTMYGLTEKGPWIYADAKTAEKDRRVWVTVEASVMQNFKQAQRETVRQLILDYVTATAENQS